MDGCALVFIGFTYLGLLVVAGRVYDDFIKDRLP